ncbi:hypothetical protein ScPMuIL_012170 [Solemya velum]
MTDKPRPHRISESSNASETSKGPLKTPITNRPLLQHEVSRTDSVRSGTSSPRMRTTSVSSQRRRSSLSLPHADALKLLQTPKPLPPELEEKTVPWWTSKRLSLSVTCFVGFFFLYALRVNLSVAIVCMTRSEEAELKVVFNGTGNQTSNSSYFSNATQGPTKIPCPSSISADEREQGDFEWDKKLRGLILGAFFWGYTIMQIPGGWLSERFGPRKVIACGMFPVALLTIISPFFAKGSPYLLLVGRVVIGMGEAMMYPGAQALWAKWSPPDERSRLVGFAFGGCQLGNALAFPISGLLCDYGFDGGWPSVFYVTGGGCFLWCCFWVFYARNTPREMPRITPLEVEYIETCTGQHYTGKKDKKNQSKPWKSIFKSGAMWAILVANACGNYGAYMLLTQMPTYMKEVLNFDIKSNGVFSMIPYLVFWVFVIIAGQFADFFISREILSIEWTRKMCCTLGTVVPAIFLVITGYMDCFHQTEAVILLTLSMAFCGFQFSSFFINHGDIAPKYAGTVFGITNTGASAPGILAPYVVGAITPNKSREEWLLAFYIAAGVYCFGAVFYMFFAKGDIQEWARDDEDEDEEAKEAIPLRGITEEDKEEEKDDDVFKPLADGSHANGTKKE